MIQENAIPQKEINSSIDQYQPDESMYLCRRWNIPDTETFNLKMGPLETFVVYKDNKIFGEYSGQQNLILHDIFKESADKIKPRVKAFKFSEGITLAKSNTVDLEFSLMDFVYNVKIGVKINFSLRYHFSDRLVFLESIMGPLDSFTYSNLQQMFSFVSEASIKRMLMKEIKDKNISIFEIPVFYNDLNNMIQTRINEKMGVFGVACKVLINRINLVENNQLTALKDIITKANEMKQLNYTYGDETFIDLIELVVRPEKEE